MTEQPPETRSERISVSLSPAMLARLNAYAAEHRWRPSTAAAILIEDGLAQAAGNQVTTS